jgi:hypothetical protein
LSNIEELKDAVLKTAEGAEGDSIAVSGDEEEYIDPDAEDTEPLPEWKPTHKIGDTEVMEGSYGNGLRFWKQRDGRKRIPSKNYPIRPIGPKVEPARQMYLDRSAFVLCANALSVNVVYADDDKGNSAQRIDDSHVRLSLKGKGASGYTNLIIQLPDEVTVIGTEMLS